MKAGTEPLRQLFCSDDPLAGIDSVTDAIDPAIWGTEIGKAAKYRKTNHNHH